MTKHSTLDSFWLNHFDSRYTKFKIVYESTSYQEFISGSSCIPNLFDINQLLSAFDWSLPWHLTIPFPSVFVTSEKYFGTNEIRLGKVNFIFSFVKLYFSCLYFYLSQKKFILLNLKLILTFLKYYLANVDLNFDIGE